MFRLQRISALSGFCQNVLVAKKRKLNSQRKTSQRKQQNKAVVSQTDVASEVRPAKS